MLEYDIWNTFTYSILELKNEKKTYLFCFIYRYEDYNYISLQKFKFHKSDCQKKTALKKLFLHYQ